MPDALDIRVSQRLKAIMKRLEKIVRQETGEDLGIGLVVFPWTRDGEPSRVAEFQYISNAPREHMHGCLKVLVAKWDGGMPDVPPHEKQ
jgi:hypothetical protein